LETASLLGGEKKKKKTDLDGQKKIGRNLQHGGVCGKDGVSKRGGVRGGALLLVIDKKGWGPRSVGERGSKHKKGGG